MVIINLNNVADLGVGDASPGAPDWPALDGSRC